MSTFIEMLDVTTQRYQKNFERKISLKQASNTLNVAHINFWIQFENHELQKFIKQEITNTKLNKYHWKKKPFSKAYCWNIKNSKIKNENKYIVFSSLF